MSRYSRNGAFPAEIRAGSGKENVVDGTQGCIRRVSRRPDARQRTRTRVVAAPPAASTTEIVRKPGSAGCQLASLA